MLGTMLGDGRDGAKIRQIGSPPEMPRGLVSVVLAAEDPRSGRIPGLYSCARGTFLRLAPGSLVRYPILGPAKAGSCTTSKSAWSTSHGGWARIQRHLRAANAADPNSYFRLPLQRRERTYLMRIRAFLNFRFQSGKLAPSKRDKALAKFRESLHSPRCVRRSPEQGRRRLLGPTQPTMPRIRTEIGDCIVAI